MNAGFLQLVDIGIHHEPHLRIIGGDHETLEGHNTHMLQNKGKTMHHKSSHYTNTIRESESCLPQKCVLRSNHLCTGPFLVAMGIFNDIERHRKNLMKIEKKKRKKERKKGQRPTRPCRPRGEKKKNAAIW